MGLVQNWIGERLPISAGALRDLTNEPVPYHLKRWWFALGGTPAYLFFVQIVTGILLAFYYNASPAVAYQSVEHITDHVAFGWYIRSIHKWAATLMIAAVILHQIRVFFTGAYRKPREINWLVGMCLLVTISCFAVSFVCHNLSASTEYAALAAWLPIMIFGPLAAVLMEGVKT